MRTFTLMFTLFVALGMCACGESQADQEPTARLVDAFDATVLGAPKPVEGTPLYVVPVEVSPYHEKMVALIEPSRIVSVGQKVRLGRVEVVPDITQRLYYVQ